MVENPTTETIEVTPLAVVKRVNGTGAETAQPDLLRTTIPLLPPPLNGDLETTRHYFIGANTEITTEITKKTGEGRTTILILPNGLTYIKKERVNEPGKCEIEIPEAEIIIYGKYNGTQNQINEIWISPENDDMEDERALNITKKCPWLKVLFQDGMWDNPVTKYCQGHRREGQIHVSRSPIQLQEYEEPSDYFG